MQLVSQSVMMQLLARAPRLQGSPGSALTSPSLCRCSLRVDVRYITWLRCLTSAQLQRHPELYSPYLVDHSSIKAFCAAEVDCMNREVDAVQILALTTELGVAVRIEYLDGSEGSGLHGYVMPEGKQEDGVVTLLYRPGHYDIIYRREDTGGKGATAVEPAATAGTEGEQAVQRAADADMSEKKERSDD
jgi:hypothetical protein